MFDDTSDIEDCSDTASQHDDDTPTANLEKEEEIALRESKAIGGLRSVVFGLLFVSMVLVATFTYIFTSRVEVTEFEHQFEEDANKILQSVGASVDSTMAAVDAFVIGILSYARETNQTWPFVTVPDLEARASKVLALTKAVVIFEFLLVMPEQREKWESYTAEKGPAWVKDSMDFLKRTNKFQDAYTALNITEPTLLNFVHDYSAWGVEDPEGLPANHSKLMLPTWQSAPLIPTTPAYNW